ncbi:MAG: DUF481 domain-containing protein [Kiritimatiellales bacterium]|nr:DUF481 domain-containing protein [Kiritimatiellales bacterium]
MAERFDWQFSETSSCYLNSELYSRMDDVLDCTALLVTGLKSKMTSKLSLFVELRDEYDSVPDSDDIEHNDVTVMAGITYDIK